MDFNADIESMNCKIRLSKGTAGDSHDSGHQHVELPTEIPDLATLIKELHKIFSLSHVKVQDVQTLMSRYKSDSKHWSNYAKFDRYKYTRNLVDAGNGAFNIMIICWGPNHASPIHDHADCHCFMKLLKGSLEEVRYDWPENVEPEVKKALKNKAVCKTNTQQDFSICQSSICPITPPEVDICERTDVREGAKCKKGEHCDEKHMVEIERNILKLDDVCYINDALGLHRMENPSDVDGAVSLHLYCPPFNSCQIFDESGKPSVAKVTFWSEYGKKIERNIPGNQ